MQFETERNYVLPFPVADVLSWRVVSELVRRHPRELWVVRTSPFSMYDCLTVRRLSSPWMGPQIHLNRNGSHMLVGRFDLKDEQIASFDPPVLPWVNVCEAPDPRDWMRWLEQMAGLPPPHGTLPASSPSSVTIRWIAQFLAMQIGSRERWSAWNADTGDPADPDNPFAAIPVAAEWVRARTAPFPAAWVWFVGTGKVGHPWNYDRFDGSPHYALSSEGDLWSRSGNHHRLDRLHTSGRPISELVYETVGEVLP